MATEIPSLFKFEHLLAHTFPGFFSAITLFMLLDIWSPDDLSSFVFAKGIEGLISFSGFILLIGSILGIILDGIHHSIIEDRFFDKTTRYCTIMNLRDKCFSIAKQDNATPKKLARSFFFKKCGGTTLNQYLIEETYCYSEFYSNTFISLLPFSFVVPFYIFETMNIPWHYALLIFLLSFSLAWVCLNSSYVAYLRYNESLFSAILGYLEVIPTKSTIENTHTTVIYKPNVEKSDTSDTSKGGSGSSTHSEKTTTNGKQTTHTTKETKTY
ncbi:MAG: hypothetical protein NTU95_01315 [Methanothrix sp.]|nr:hypothetical protein [Methanothrix sp.]